MKQFKTRPTNLDLKISIFQLPTSENWICCFYLFEKMFQNQNFVFSYVRHIGFV